MHSHRSCHAFASQLSCILIAAVIRSLRNCHSITLQLSDAPALSPDVTSPIVFTFTIGLVLSAFLLPQLPNNANTAIGRTNKGMFFFILIVDPDYGMQAAFRQDSPAMDRGIHHCGYRLLYLQHR